jgi:hypothetical protein
MTGVILIRYPNLVRNIIILVALVSGGCASAPPIDQIDLMPAPDVFGDGMINPLPEYYPFDEIPYGGILYATDREPATEDDREKYYLNDRGKILRLGVAEVTLGEKKMTWDFARQFSMLKTRTEKFPIKVTNVQEWGVLESTVPYWIDPDTVGGAGPQPDATDRYAEAINAQLARSKSKHVYIYVHGYKVVYENPILVGSELWHFLGYEGVFIAYAWPSTPSKFAYIKDSDTSSGFARNFRLLLEFLSTRTDVEEIHVVGYSNGTRLVTRAMEQLALINQGKTAEEIYRKLRIRNVILVGSDVDRGVFSSYVADGLLDVSRHLTIYMSEYDKALGVSQFLTRRQRLGQMWGGKGGEMTPDARKALIDLHEQISFINVSPAEGAGTGNGHGYFRSSPWASSDVLMTLAFGLTPEQRGLVEQDDLPIYTFPPDYVSRLWDAIETADPEFAKVYREYKESLPSEEQQ